MVEAGDEGQQQLRQLKRIGQVQLGGVAGEESGGPAPKRLRDKGKGLGGGSK